MKRIQLESVKAGAKFSHDVFVDGKNLFVPAGVVVKQKDIDQLKRWGITQLQTEGQVVSEMPKPKAREGEDGFIPDLKSEAILKPQAVNSNSELYRLYKDMVEKLEAFFAELQSGKTPDKRNFDLIIESLLQSVRDRQREVIGFILGGDLKDMHLAKSSVNSAILSAIIGIQMKLPAHRLLHLVTGALLHDLGMTSVPDSITQKKTDLSEAETQKMRAHPLHSHKIIAKELGYPEDIAKIGLQHHERWDGEGYPRRLRGEDIDILARIVSVADAFEAMVSRKPYRNSMIGYAAMKNLLADNSRRFDPEVLRVFVKSMGIYPIGSIVLLNNGAIARVVDVHRDTPLRPKLRILIDENSRQYSDDDGDLIDLLSEKTLFIARAIDPEDLREG